MTDEVLGRIGGADDPGVVLFARDGKAAVWVERDGPAEYVVSKGRRGPKCGGVRTIWLSADGAHVGAVVAGKPWRVVVDGKAHEDVAEVRSPAFDADGRLVAYAGVAGKRGPANILPGSKAYVVLGGKRSKGYEQLRGPVLSRHGSLAFSESGKIHVGKKTFGPFEAADAPVFSPDGRSCACVVRQAGQCFLWRDGDVRFGPHDGIGSIEFAATGAMAWTARDGESFRVVVDGFAGREYSAVGRPVWSPSGRLAYAAEQGRRRFVVFDVAEHDVAKADRVSDPVWSPDGARFAYSAVKGRNHATVTDGGIETWYDVVGAPVFSPIGELAYLAMADRRYFIVGPGGESERFDHVSPAPVWGRNGRVAYGAKRGAKAVMVAGRAVSDEADGVGEPRWNGEAVEYGAVVGREVRWRSLTSK